MTRYLIITLVGDDQPGLVDRVAQTVAGHSGNWLESNMSHLAGKFAGILRVSVDEQHADELIEALEQLSDKLRLVVEKSDVEEAGPASPTRNLHLSLVGNDRPGIVREVFRILAELQVNVEELETECSSAPMSADTLFQARAVLDVPPGIEMERLQAALEKIADDMIVDISLEALSAD